MKKLVSFVFVILFSLFIFNAHAQTLEEKKDSATFYNQADDGYTTKMLSQTLWDIGSLVKSRVPGCAPDALVNVLGYWNDKGCKIFEADGKKTYCKELDYNSAQVEDLLNTAWENLGTFQFGTTGWTPFFNLKSGISKTLADYNLTGTVICYYLGQITFDLIKNEIDNDRPCIVGISIWPFSNYFRHYVCIIGYKVTNSVFGENYLMYVDSSGLDKKQAWYKDISKNPGILCTINLQCSETTTTTTSTTTTIDLGSLVDTCNALDKVTVSQGSMSNTENDCYAIYDIMYPYGGKETLVLLIHRIFTTVGPYANASDFWETHTLCWTGESICASGTSGLCEYRAKDDGNVYREDSTEFMVIRKTTECLPFIQNPDNSSMPTRKMTECPCLSR